MQHAGRWRPRAAALLLGAALALAPALSAQASIRAGQTVSGELTQASPLMEDSSHYQLYTYHGRAGEHLSIIMKSTVFDAYLAFGRMSGGQFSADETDDDGAGGTDAKVEVTLAADGDYVIRANTLAPGQTGAYTLSVQSGAAPRVVPAAAAVRGSIGVGQTVNGALSAADPKADDDSYYQIWTIQAQAGQRITIDLKSSAFDAYLVWGRLANGAFAQIESDDDSGGGTDARVVVTPATSGTYAIRANTLTAGETGAYTLSVTAGGAEPVASTPSRGNGAPGAALAVVGSLRAGQDVGGTLSASDARMADDSYYDDYTYQGRAGERLTVTLKSAAFDAYLHFGRLNGSAFSSIDTDDDGAGGTDSKVEVTLPADGTYVIRANSLTASASGAYTVRVDSAR
ncbi:MAG: peptidase [Gemmatimonadetes bacterium]|nr:peptidase [Gemmatimonadota bacterium]